MAPKDQVVAPADRATLPDTIYIRIPSGYYFEKDGAALGYCSMYRSKDAAMDSLAVGDKLFELGVNVRYVCQKEVTASTKA